MGTTLSITKLIDRILRDLGLGRLAELDAIDPLDQDTRILESALLQNRCAILLRHGRHAELAKTAQRLLLAADRLPRSGAPEQLLVRGLALAYLGRREEARPLIEQGVAGGWSWTGVIDHLERVDLRPRRLPAEGVDFRCRPKCRRCSSRAREDPLPWEAAGSAD